MIIFDDGHADKVMLNLVHHVYEKIRLTYSSGSSGGAQRVLQQVLQIYC